MTVCVWLCLCIVCWHINLVYIDLLLMKANTVWYRRCWWMRCRWINGKYVEKKHGNIIFAVSRNLFSHIFLLSFFSFSSAVFRKQNYGGNGLAELAHVWIGCGVRMRWCGVLGWLVGWLAGWWVHSIYLAFSSFRIFPVCLWVP